MNKDLRGAELPAFGAARGGGLDGLLLLYKEIGRTSFEALSPIKKTLKGVKAGHTGTLDKFASGLLLVLLGRALKLVPWTSFCDKEYVSLIRFGTETDTLDPEGAVVAEAPLPGLKEFEEILPLFRGRIMQAPPQYSALHINGRRAYELVRAGENPEMKKRPVTVYSLELEDWSPPFASVRVRCSAGTYIRSLARDIAIASGSRAHLAALERTRIGGFTLENTFRFKDENPEKSGDALRNAALPITAEIAGKFGLPFIFVTPEEEKALVHGKPLGPLEEKLPASDIGAAALFSSGNRKLVAVLEKKENLWRYGHVFGGAPA